VTAPRTVSFTVYGTARPKGSHQPFLHRITKQIIMKPASAGLRAWEAGVREEAQKLAAQGVFFQHAVRVIVTFTFARPTSVSVKKRAYMTVAPDLDKLARAIFDPLTGVLWKDDSFVTELLARKVYGASDEPSRAVITISELAPQCAAQPLLATQEDLYATPAR
jgi:Holliday junction resolvase RusA-like endonuclease